MIDTFQFYFLPCLLCVSECVRAGSKDGSNWISSGAMATSGRDHGAARGEKSQSALSRRARAGLSLAAAAGAMHAAAAAAQHTMEPQSGERLCFDLRRLSWLGPLPATNYAYRADQQRQQQQQPGDNLAAASAAGAARIYRTNEANRAAVLVVRPPSPRDCLQDASGRAASMASGARV